MRVELCAVISLMAPPGKETRIVHGQHDRRRGRDGREERRPIEPLGNPMQLDDVRPGQSFMDSSAHTTSSAAEKPGPRLTTFPHILVEKPVGISRQGRATSVEQPCTLHSGRSESVEQFRIQAVLAQSALQTQRGQSGAARQL